MSDLTSSQRYFKIKEAYLKKDMATVKELAKTAGEELHQKGYIKALPVFSWIKKDWLDKAIAIGAIVVVGNEYFPSVLERDEIVVDEYRGRSAITHTKTVLDSSKFTNFLKEYEEYEKNNAS